MGHKPNPERPAALLAWELAFGAPPPLFLSVSFMQQALEYETQRKQVGVCLHQHVACSRRLRRARLLPQCL